MRPGHRNVLDNKQVSRTRAQATRNQLQEANSSCGRRKKFLRGIIFGLYFDLAVDTKTNHLSSSQEISCIRNTVIIMCVYIPMCKLRSDRQLRLIFHDTRFYGFYLFSNIHRGKFVYLSCSQLPTSMERLS